MVWMLHRFEQMNESAAHRQLCRITSHLNEQAADFVPASAFKKIQIDDGRAMHLPKALGIKLRSEVGDGGAYEMFARGSTHHGVLVVGLEEKDILHF